MLGERYCVASESCAFDIIGAELLREVQPGEVVSLDRARARDPPWRSRATRARLLRLRAHLLRAPRLAPRGPRAPGLARADGRDPLARGAGRGRPGDPGARTPGNAAARGYARAAGIPQDDGFDQEPLRRAHVHPARAGAAQARPAAEVQPAARGRAPASAWSSSTTRSCAATRRARSCRCCATPARPRSTCASPRRRSAIPATTGSTCPRARRWSPTGARSTRSPRSSAATRWPTSRSRASTRRSAADARTHCDACFSGEYPLDRTAEANGKFALENELPLVRA